MEDSLLKPTSHNGEKVRNYSTDLKLEILRYAEANSIHAASKKYKVDRNSIRDWKGKKSNLEEHKKSSSGIRKRLDGGGIHITLDKLEENLLEWIFDRRSKGLRVSRKLVKLKATKLQEEMEIEDPTITTLKFSEWWLEKFMKRNGLTVRRCTTVAQKGPDQLLDKLCLRS